MSQIHAFRWLPAILAVALFAGLLGSATAAAQGQCSISGTVRDSTQAVLPGVSLTMLNLGNGRSTLGMTSAEGKFEFKGLVPGQYRLTADLPGFSSEGRSLTLAAGDALPALPLFAEPRRSVLPADLP